MDFRWDTRRMQEEADRAQTTPISKISSPKNLRKFLPTYFSLSSPAYSHLASYLIIFLFIAKQGTISVSVINTLFELKSYRILPKENQRYSSVARMMTLLSTATT